MVSIVESLEIWIGTANNPVGDTILLTLAGVTFIMVFQGFLYILWRVSTWGK